MLAVEEQQQLEQQQQQQDSVHISRQVGSLVEALKNGAEVVKVVKHATNDNCSVYILFPDHTKEMVYPNVSLHHIKEYSVWCPSLATHSQSMHEEFEHPGLLFHDLMNRPGSKIVQWHPTHRGDTYTVHIQGSDGQLYVYSSISEMHMKEHVRGFMPGSTRNP